MVRQNPNKAGRFQDDKRPDPDALLARVEADANRVRKGKLKIYFGMAAGVGKTYAMLESAQRIAQSGEDIVIGYVESHGRAETDSLLTGLTSVPPMRMNHNGLEVSELDLDRILLLHPAIVVIDEMAHTNAEGCRHRRRYQDIVELLDAGINVWTSLNVQHVASQSDTVFEITGIKVRETIPDSLIDMADTIEVIDLEPSELIARFRDGKVYRPEGIENALSNFFRVPNLMALREMTLNVAARRINRDVSDYLQRNGIEGPWKTREKILVAISPSPQTAYLIRWVRRLASNLQASWLAVYVDPLHPLSAIDQESLAQNLALARELGGDVVTTPDPDLAEGILRIARRHNASQIVIGRSYRKKRWLPRSRDLIQQIIEKSGNIDVHVVTEPLQKRREGKVASPPLPFREYFLGAVTLFALGLGCFLAQPFIHYWATAFLFLTAVSLLGLYLSRGPIFFTALLSALGWNWFFIPPLYRWEIKRIEDIVMFCIYFLMALVSGQLTARLKQRHTALLQREFRLGSLYELTAALSRTSSVAEILNQAGNRLYKLFGSTVSFLMASANDELEEYQTTEHRMELSEKDRSIALWVYENGRPAGRHTPTMQSLENYFIPMTGPNGTIGVLVMRRAEDQVFSLDQTSLLEAIVSQISLAVEREILAEQKRRMVQQEESERISRLLLSTVSHELRTPIAAIQSAASTMFLLLSGQSQYQEIATEILRGSRRLDRLVRNLLEMHRLESFNTRLKLDYYDLEDIIGTTLSELSQELGQRQIIVHPPKVDCFLKVDFVLIIRALSNLVLNAAAYSPPDTPITIGTVVEPERSRVIITVEDRGPGIDPADLSHIFEKFYRGQNMPPGGSGLGLSIVNGIVELHQGRVSARNGGDSGAIFEIELFYDRGQDINRRR